MKLTVCTCFVSGDESQSLFCSETFISPTPPSDDCGYTWTTTNGTATSAQSTEPVNDATQSGFLLKAALLGGRTDKTEYLEKDINSNLQTKCAVDTLKFYGNDAESVRRMSGSNGYDRNRMTGSTAGGGNSSLSRLSDGSGAQGQSQPQVAAAEGMLLGRVGGTGGVAVHDPNSRSIVAGTAGAGPPVTIGSVFRPPQTVSDTPRYGAASSSPVGPFSPLHTPGSHGAGINPYTAFYSQYPGYSPNVMPSTIDPQLSQFGSYSAVLQTIGSHAAQSQIPRSPYGTTPVSAGVLGQYPLSAMAQTSSPGAKAYPSTNLGAHDHRDDGRYKREQESDIHRRYSTSVLKDEKSHQFSVPSGFTEPTRASFSSIRESPIHKRELPSGDFYKIPTGREGSLKHRILRTSDSAGSFSTENPHSAFKTTDEPSQKRTKLEHHSVTDNEIQRPRASESGITTSIDSAQSRTTHLHYPHHFMKGSIIQLGNGEYKRVEELKTEDFVQSAEISSDLKVDSSTVVHINENEAHGTAVLGFLVGEHKVQVCSPLFLLEILPLLFQRKKVVLLQYP